MRHVRELPGNGVRLHLLAVFILVPAAFNLHLLTRPVLVGEAVYYTQSTLQAGRCCRFGRIASGIRLDGHTTGRTDTPPCLTGH